MKAVLPLLWLLCGCISVSSERTLISRLDEVIDRMGSSDFTERERATKELYTLLGKETGRRTVLIEHIHKRFHSTGDEEVRYRLEPIIYPWKHLKKIFELKHGETVADMAFSPKDGFLVSASGNRIYMWDYRTGRQVYSLEQRSPVYAVAFSSDGSVFASLGYDSNVWIWNPETGKRLLRRVGRENR